MTRKRYIKLLMGQGMSRNEATEAALYDRLAELPYAVGYTVSVCWVVDKTSQKNAPSRMGPDRRKAKNLHLNTTIIRRYSQ